MWFATFALALASDTPEGVKIGDAAIKVNPELWEIVEDDDGVSAKRKKKKKGEVEVLYLDCHCASDDGICNVHISDTDVWCYDARNDCCELVVSVPEDLTGRK